MALYGAKAQYNNEEPIEGEYPGRLMVCSKHTIADIFLSDEDYRAISRALEDFTGDHVIDATYIEDGSFSISTANPDATDDWQFEIEQGSLEIVIVASSVEIRKAEKVMKDPHPDFEDFPEVSGPDIEMVH